MMSAEPRTCCQLLLSNSKISLKTFSFWHLNSKSFQLHSPCEQQRDLKRDDEKSLLLNSRQLQKLDEGEGDEDEQADEEVAGGEENESWEVSE